MLSAVGSAVGFALGLLIAPCTARDTRKITVNASDIVGTLKNLQGRLIIPSTAWNNTNCDPGVNSADSGMNQF